jgi:transcriptional regulator with XRE-family HTH domain
MSLYDVRSRTGLSVSKLSLIERGIEEASEDEKKRLSRALGVRPEEIFPAERNGIDQVELGSVRVGRIGESNVQGKR